MDADLIARFTGPYNLPGGKVPLVDGMPRWPWDEVVARRRLGQVAKLAGLRLSRWLFATVLVMLLLAWQCSSCARHSPACPGR